MPSLASMLAAFIPFFFFFLFICLFWAGGGRGVCGHTQLCSEFTPSSELRGHS